MQQAGDDLGEHPERTEGTGKRHASPDREQVRVHQGGPHRGRLGADLNGDLVRDVEGGKKSVSETDRHGPLHDPGTSESCMHRLRRRNWPVNLTQEEGAR